MDDSEHSDVGEPNTSKNKEQSEVVNNQMNQIFLNLISEIDDRVLKLGESQHELEAEIDQLFKTLDGIKVDDGLTNKIISSSKRIASMKSRITLCHNILSTSSERCNRVLAAASSMGDMNSSP